MKHAYSKKLPPLPSARAWRYNQYMLAIHSALERVLRPSEGDVPDDYACRLLELDFAEADHARYRELSEKAQLGQLSDRERVEFDDLLTTNDVLTILHAKARASLKQMPFQGPEPVRNRRRYWTAHPSFPSSH